ncbi:MAG: hypothetical protein ABR992_08155 [Solirubrobacteraceae bacterium]
MVTAPFALIGLWIAYQIASELLRFESLNPYASELSQLPAPAKLVSIDQLPVSPPLGYNSSLYRERDYAFDSTVTGQAVYNYYNAQLTNRGWKLYQPGTNTPNDMDNEFEWRRAGSHGDTISFLLTYYIGSDQLPPTYDYSNALELRLETDINGTLAGTSAK